MEDSGVLAAKQRMDAGPVVEARDGDIRKVAEEPDMVLVNEKTMMPVNQVVEETKLAAEPYDEVAAAADGIVPDGKVVMVSIDNRISATEVYPAPLMSHEEVIRNPGVFMDVLKRFHTTMDTKFKIPFVGGKDLDLHLLYVEVTQRGGLEKVINGRRWREVVTALNFPPTTTSASFVLKKYYISLLHHFEQVYFFRLQGPLIPPAAILQTVRQSSTLAPYHPNQVHQQQQEQLLVAGNITRGLTDSESHIAAFTHIPCSTCISCPPLTVSGTIDGKFEHGYLVSVTVGLETMHGVLFHTLPDPQEEAAALAAASSSPIVPLPPFSNAIIPDTYLPIGPGWSQKKARSHDPELPKRSRSMYNFFSKKRSKLKKLTPQRGRESSKMTRESMNKLTEEERMVYEDIRLEDKDAGWKCSTEKD